MVSAKDVCVVIHVYICSSTSQEGGVEEVLSPLDQLVYRRVVS